MTKTTQLGVVMDPIASIQPAKDSSLALLLQAQAAGWQLYCLEIQDLWLRDGDAFGRATPICVADDPDHWFQRGDPVIMPLHELDVVLMRKDPPFNMEYIFATYILERAELRGSLVVNRPQALRDANEKMVVSWVPDCVPPWLVSSSLVELRAFVAEQQRVVVKPLDRMGGRSIFVTHAGDPNRNVILETLTNNGSQFVMVQKYIAEAPQGDKRIILIDGDPVPFGLLRIPPPDDFRGNLCTGATPQAVPLTERDRWICEQLAPLLRSQGLLFVGIDVIGDYLTEVNVTSPTGIRELDQFCGLNIGRDIIAAIAKKLG